ncbi:LysR substrate-binding domain-containing protein [Azospirillum sp. ST 5-10]|uniref:LysR substrate-binding domain-containing protein n=1 Tax=unclassified Azospirillum TaxID=2630922 RepID=UPI003F4A855F
MELRHLRYFAALAERLNFTHAAEKVHVTQSTLSHQIKQLEEEIGQRLFDRVGKRVVMTEAGELLLPSVTKALREIDDGVRTLKGTARPLRGMVRIGATHTFNISLIPSCLATFLTNNPAVRVTVEELPAAAIEDRLRSGDLDIGISYRPAELRELWFEPLYNEEMVLAVGAQHPFAARKRIRIVELHRQNLVLLPREFTTRRMLDGCFQSAGAEPVVVAETNTIAAMLSLVRRMEIAAIVSEQAVSDLENLRIIALESPTPLRTPGILWKRDGERAAAVRSFAVIVRRAVSSAKLRRPRADAAEPAPL